MNFLGRGFQNVERYRQTDGGNDKHHLRVVKTYTHTHIVGYLSVTAAISQKR